MSFVGVTGVSTNAAGIIHQKLLCVVQQRGIDSAEHFFLFNKEEYKMGYGSDCGVFDEMKKYLKKFCTERIEKMGLHSLRSGACKSCPYRYRGTNKNSCCMFGTLPRDWDDVDINE